MESNIVNKGYSFTMNQYYSLSQNKVRVDLHAHGSDTVLIQVSLLKLVTHPYLHWGLRTVTIVVGGLVNYAELFFCLHRCC